MLLPIRETQPRWLPAFLCVALLDGIVLLGESSKRPPMFKMFIVPSPDDDSSYVPICTAADHSNGHSDGGGGGGSSGGKGKLGEYAITHGTHESFFRDLQGQIYTSRFPWRLLDIWANRASPSPPTSSEYADHPSWRKRPTPHGSTIDVEDVCEFLSFFSMQETEVICAVASSHATTPLEGDIMIHVCGVCFAHNALTGTGKPFAGPVHNINFIHAAMWEWISWTHFHGLHAGLPVGASALMNDGLDFCQGNIGTDDGKAFIACAHGVGHAFMLIQMYNSANPIYSRPAHVEISGDQHDRAVDMCTAVSRRPVSASMMFCVDGLYHTYFFALKPDSALERTRHWSEPCDTSKWPAQCFKYLFTEGIAFERTLGERGNRKYPTPLGAWGRLSPHLEDVLKAYDCSSLPSVRVPYPESHDYRALSGCIFGVASHMYTAFDAALALTAAEAKTKDQPACVLGGIPHTMLTVYAPLDSSFVHELEFAYTAALRPAQSLSIFCTWLTKNWLRRVQVFNEGPEYAQRPPLSCIAGALYTILEYRPNYDMGSAICRSVALFPPLDSESTTFLRQACRMTTAGGRDVTPLFSKLLASTTFGVPLRFMPADN